MAEDIMHSNDHNVKQTKDLFIHKKIIKFLNFRSKKKFPFNVKFTNFITVNN